MRSKVLTLLTGLVAASVCACANGHDEPSLGTSGAPARQESANIPSATASVGSSSAAAARVAGHLYVADGHGPGSVSVIDIARGKVARTFQLALPKGGGFPAAAATGVAVSIDGSRLLISTTFAGVEVIDVATGSVVASSQLAAAASYGIAVVSKGPAMFVLQVAGPDGTTPVVRPIDVVDGNARDPITVGDETQNAQAIVASPVGDAVYVLLFQGALVRVDTASLQTSPPIAVSHDANGVAITPDGKHAYIAEGETPGVLPVDLQTGVAGQPIRFGTDPRALAITPDGTVAYVADAVDRTVVPLNLATGEPGPPIPLPVKAKTDGGGDGMAIVITPDGRWAYVADSASDTVVPINLSTRRAGTPLPAGSYPVALAFGP